ncbi:MAG: hypothetical protein KDB22_20870 [Planctomycetales bacterium]|nr:hypothetical protein [Planctomycetales bacterium]
MNRILILTVGLLIFGVGIEFARSTGSQAQVEARVEPESGDQQADLPFEPPVITALSPIDRAYAAIGSRRTKFDPTNESILPSDREYLLQSAALVEQAVLWRVSAEQALKRNEKDRSNWVVAGQNLVKGFDLLSPPAHLRRYNALTQESIDRLRQYYQMYLWSQPSVGEPHNEQILRQASIATRSAYAELTHIYPSRNAQAEAAFYDMHHALDPL